MHHKHAQAVLLFKCPEAIQLCIQAQFSRPLVVATMCSKNERVHNSTVEAVKRVFGSHLFDLTVFDPEKTHCKICAPQRAVFDAAYKFNVA